MELFDEGEVIPASEMQRPQQALDREMFQDASERFNQAQGGRTGFDEGSFKISDISDAWMFIILPLSSYFSILLVLI